RRGNIYTDGTSASVRTVGTNGLNTARVTASGNSVTLFSATNGQRYLELNDTGIWIRTGPRGNQKVYNLEETAQDSGWHNGTIQPGYSLQNNLVPKARKVGNAIYLSGGVAGGGIGANTSQHVLTLPAGFHPTKEWLYTMGSPSTGAASP